MAINSVDEEQGAGTILRKEPEALIPTEAAAT